MRVLVVASSFPSVNQPWLTTYLSQLDARGIAHTIVTMKRDPDAVDRRAGGPYVARCVFIPPDGRALLREWLRILARRPLRELVAAVRVGLSVRSPDVDVKTKLRMVLTTLCLMHRLPRERFDLIHVHFDQDALFFLPYARLSKTPIVTTFHGMNPVGVKSMPLAHRRATYRGVDRVIVNTEFARTQVVAMGCSTSIVHILPQGTVLDDFPFAPLPPPAPGEPVRIITVGRLQADKGQVWALLAAARLCKQGYDVEWWFAGTGPDLARLERLAQRLGLGRRVRFFGVVPHRELRSLYGQAHIFVLPSINNSRGYIVETQGVAIQEAQASGCITIASAVGGIPECIEHGVTGLLVRDRSSRALAEAIRWVLAHPEAWTPMREAARRHVERNFDASIIGSRMEQLYREVIARAGGTAERRVYETV